MANPVQLLRSLARAYSLTAGSSAPAGPELEVALQSVLDAQEAVGWVVARVEDGGLRVQGEEVAEGNPELEELAAALARAGIGELRFQEVLSRELLHDFLGLLRRAAEGEEAMEGSLHFRGVVPALGLSFQGTGRRPPGMAGSVQELFRERVLAAEPEPAPSPPEDAGGRQAFPEELREAVEDFLLARGSRREELRLRIVRAAGELRQKRDFPALATLVEMLAEGAGEDERNGEAGNLARELTVPAVASQIAARLGSVRQEEERLRLTTLAARLGREMALAVADALGEARDRFQRRAYMDAMVALGEAGKEVIHQMVEDPRWFVVRNGVSLLGETGGEEGLSSLVGALAHADPRVRREAVLALGKVGGVDAGLLLVGMLDDPEVEVRAMACRAVGALRVQKAFKPLMRLLEEDPAEDVQVESLLALGRLGDPGAVPLIGKRALKGLFSKPQREVRIAAYKALASIGTPHARRLLEEATQDRDPGVRSVAQALAEED